MTNQHQRLKLTLAALAGLAFIALLVVLALLLSGGAVRPLQLGTNEPIYGTAGVLPAGATGAIPSSGRYGGNTLSFPFPKGAANLQSAGSANSEYVSFTVGAVAVRVSTEVAPVGLTPALLAASYGTNARAVTLAAGPGYLVQNPGSNTVILFRFAAGRFVFVQAAGSSGALGLAKQVDSSLKIRPLASAQLSTPKS